VLDDQGRVGLIETYDGGGLVYHRILYTYDSTGRLSMKCFYGPGRSVYDKRIFAYGVDGRTEERLFYKDKDEACLDRRILYRYDEKDNLVDLTAYDSNSSPIGRTSHALRYDSAGNWIQRVSQTCDVTTGKPTAEWIEYQVITYGDLPTHDRGEQEFDSENELRPYADSDSEKIAAVV
jgi:hypothetical protein